MRKGMITCSECKTKNKKPKNKTVFTCKKCHFTIYSNSETKKRFQLLKKITGISDKNAFKTRENNLVEIQNCISTNYKLIVEDLARKRFKEAEKKLYQLFTFDNTSNKKYYYLLLLQLNVHTSEDAYEAFRKLSKKRRNVLINSNYFQILHKDEIYQAMLDDIILHKYHNKRKKNDRIIMTKDIL